MSAATLDLPAPLTAAQRRQALAAAISCVAVFGIAIGLGGPLLALLLEGKGVDASLNGINAAATFLGVIIGPLLTPFLVRRFGVRRVLVACLLLEVGFWPLLKLFDMIPAWMVLRFLMGLVGSSFFTVTEAWIIVIAGDEGRGRVVGLYAVALSVGFGIGPLLLSLTGLAGWTPFITGAAIILAAALPFLLTRGLPMAFGEGARGSVRAVFAQAPLIVLAVVVFGLYEAAALALLPVWGVRLGFTPQLAATMLTTIYLGSIALQMPIGWLSDRIARRTVLRLCGAAGLIGAALLPFIADSTPLLFAVLLLWGGIASGLYPVALSMAGDRFRGANMVTANAALVVGYGLGALVGPIIGGGAIDLWNPHGLLVVFVVVFGLLVAATFLPRREPL